jgi:hypothetical protein
MPRAAGFIATVVGGLVLSPLAGTASACGPRAARTLAADPVARVYASGGEVYGCAAGGAGAHRLGSSRGSIASAEVGTVRLAGRVAAYELQTAGIDTGRASVEVRRLSTGRLLAQRPATTTIGVEGFQSIDALVVKPDGAVAWIATARSIGPPRFIRQVERVDARGFRVLDSGPRVAPTSLRLRRSTRSWRHRTTEKTATLR